MRRFVLLTKIRSQESSPVSKSVFFELSIRSMYEHPATYLCVLLDRLKDEDARKYLDLHHSLLELDLQGQQE